MAVSSPSDRIDFKRWFDRVQPQTLQIATWLLYINGVFLVLGFLDTSNEIGLVRNTSAVGFVLAAVAAFSHPLGAFLMANGRRLGYWLAIIATLSPFAMRVFLEIKFGYVHKIDVVLGGDFVGGAFDIALVALVLHPMSQKYARIWLT